MSSFAKASEDTRCVFLHSFTVVAPCVGGWNRSDVHEEADFVRPQAIDELTDGSGRMADGPECRMSRHAEVLHSERGIATGLEERESVWWQFFGIDFE